MRLTVIILARDEALHITRAIASLRGLKARVVVVDSGSGDDTVALAKAAGAEVLSNPWQGYARQFNWALRQIRETSDWVLRLDADEVLDARLVDSINNGLADPPPDVVGFTIDRFMTFQGRLIRFGGVFPVRILRLFRADRGSCEARWMDEHIVVDGKIGHLRGALIDDNQKPLSWWTDKHNTYANREALDMLLPDHRSDDAKLGSAAGTKRWIKQNVYAGLPAGLRAMLYFLYRYVIRFGFLDGRAGTTFHVLQGFWYRYLVDAKINEVRGYMSRDGLSFEEAASVVLEIDVKKERPA